MLFVCEKRAAIDVVYARLKQTGLGPLGCLIHDSQSDKKEFILDLKQTYETLTSALDDEAAKRGRNAREALLRRIDKSLSPLEQFDETMQSAPDSLGLATRELLERCLELEHDRPAVSPEEAEGLPPYAEWQSHREPIATLQPAISELEPSGVWAKHPLRLLSPSLAQDERPIERVSAAAAHARQTLTQVLAALRASGIPADQWPTLRRVRELLTYFNDVAPLARNGNIGLADPKSSRAKQFTGVLNRVRKLETDLLQAQQATANWRQKLPAADIPAALEQSQQFAKSTLRFLSLAWWRLRGVLNRSYNFQAHAVRPTWVQVLTALQQEYNAAAALQQAMEETKQQFQLDRSPLDLDLEAKRFLERVPQFPPWLAKIHHALLKSPKAEAFVDKTLAADAPARELFATLDSFATSYEQVPLEQLAADLKAMLAAVRQVPRALQLLGELGQLPDGVSEVFRTRPWTVEQAEAAVARHSWDELCRANRELNQFNGTLAARSVEQLEKQYDDWLAANANEIMSRVKQRFLDNARLANQNAAQLSPEQREFKKCYSQGRRTLEHEFGKSMRYKSIRELVDGDSGLVIRDLKPVWLMSPLSVSDTLPLAADFFDVVIFDEASQVTLEEAVPSIFRGQQVIVVGDEMQLPPTDFFSTKGADDEEEGELLIEESGEQVRYDLQSDSFLSHTAKNLPSTMLGWHYRSRSETLISFSNWAFYDGRLLTVPDCRLPSQASAPVVRSGVPTGIEHLLANPLSFHHLPRGVYDNRRNRAEAEYIATLVRDLLASGRKQSIAIIAFSEAQQEEIESALHRQTLDDDDFRQRYEEELQREVDGQFVGLLVKNLENIQGDERDVVILSICYGPNPAGKMLMNFGPINKSGGEKRLNVAFSRAKQFMAVVSSIQHTQITNDYNEGANCLKNYLRYAESISRGDLASSRRVLASISRWSDAAPSADETALDAVARQLRDELITRGFQVDCAVGQSHFRVDLAIRRPGDTHYRLGLLIDTTTNYEHSTPLERDLLRPRLLRAFGWRIVSLLAKDWLENRATVLEELSSQIAD